MASSQREKRVSARGWLGLRGNLPAGGRRSYSQVKLSPLQCHVRRGPRALRVQHEVLVVPLQLRALVSISLTEKQKIEAGK